MYHVSEAGACEESLDSRVDKRSTIDKPSSIVLAIVLVPGGRVAVVTRVPYLRYLAVDAAQRSQHLRTPTGASDSEPF